MSRSFRNNSRSFPNQPKRESVGRVRVQQQNISQAETSEDEHGVKIAHVRPRSTERKESHQGHSYYEKDRKDIHNHRQQYYSHSRSHAKLDTSQSSTTRESSRPRNSSASFNNNANTSRSRTFTNHKSPSHCPFPPPPPSQSPKKHHYNDKTITVEEDQHTIAKILSRITSLDHKGQSYWTLKDIFIKICSHHIKIVGRLPQSVTHIGEQLLKNGEFHNKWIQILKKQSEINLQPLFESYFVRYRQKLKRNVDLFQRELNIFKDPKNNKNQQGKDKKQVERILEQQQQKQREANMELKRYRSLIDEQLRQGQHNQHHQNYRSPSLHHYNQPPTPLPHTQSTTKLDTMLLYQQLKQQLHLSQLETHITQTVQNTINQWKQKTSQLQKQASQYQPICDMDLMFETQHGIVQKWNDIQQLQKRKQAIEQLEKQRVRQRSPLSNRFRMMHQCQTNARRMQVQMACMFLNCESFFYLQDLEILNVQETIFSDTQQIVVMKAYAVEYDPRVGMMRLQPKIKTLISVYKFCGLSQLIRLEKTYGRFDGIVVYPQSFDIQKYLANNKDLSLVKDRFLSEVKGQLPLEREQIGQKRNDEKPRGDKMIEY